MKKLRFFFLGLLFFSCSTDIDEDSQTLLFLDNYDGISWVLRRHLNLREQIVIHPIVMVKSGILVKSLRCIQEIPF